MRNSHYIFILLAVAIFLFFFNLGSTALTDPDETFYAQTAKEMTAQGEWVTPHIFGEPQFEKPVFYYWLIMASYKIFGINEFAARFPSAIFGIIGVLGIYFLGRLLFSKECGFFSGLILATSMQYLVLARGCVTDMVLGTFIMLTLLCFLLGWMKERRSWYFLAAVCASLAVLTKGPIGLFIPGLTVLIYTAVTGEWKKFLKIPFFWCIVIFVLVGLPWYLAVIREHGAIFIGEFFGFQNVTRFLHPEHRIGASPLFYIPIVIAGFFPWSIFFPVSCWNMFKTRVNPEKLKATGIFLAAWFGVVFIFFSISRTKLVTYIFPLYPAMAIVTARLFERFFALKREENPKFFLSYIFLVIFGIAAVITVVAIAYDEYGTGLMMAIAGGCASVFLIGAVCSLVLFLKDKKQMSFFSVVATILVLVVPLTLFLLPEVQAYESSKTLALKLKGLALSGEDVGGESDHRRGIAFYSDRIDIEDVHPYHDFKMFLERKDRVWGIIQKKHYDQYRKEKPDRFVQEVEWSGKYVLITNKPLKGLNPKD
ncbi:ArnT family glycosyltransferase [Candidatus Omnitrophota bacterium]